MPRITSFSEGSHVPAASLNAMQDRAKHTTRATGAPAGLPAVLGRDEVIWQTETWLDTGTLAIVDTGLRDWRERFVRADVRFALATNQTWGGASQHAGNAAEFADTRHAVGPLGPGAVGAASATVVNGTPPAVASGSCPLPLDVRAGGTLWLYADPDDGSLRVYNATGETLYFDLLVDGTAKPVLDESIPPPDVVPTLTDILWLTPTALADRPTPPSTTRAIHRATDTGDISLWDGSAWRTLIAAAPAAAPEPTRFLPVCLYATTDLSSATACGRCRVDPADLARSGLTTALTLEVIGDVSTVGPSGSVELYDLTAAAVVATITFTETTPTRKTASVVLPGAAHLYELRVSLSGGSGPGDYLTIGGAQLRVTWS